MIRNTLRFLVRSSVRHPARTLAVWVALVAASAAMAYGWLTLRTSNLDLIDSELPPVKAFVEFANEFGTPNVLVVVFEGTDEKNLESAVDRVVPVLERAQGVRGVIARLPLSDDELDALGADRYVTSRDRRMFFAFVQPSDPSSSAEALGPFVETVRRSIDKAGLDALGVRAGLTGLPVYAVEDREVIQADISRLSTLSFVLVLLMFVAGFGSLRRPALAMIAMTAGVGASLGPISIYPGHLTLLSAFFASILFGLGIDYGIHIVGRVEELVAEGVREREAIQPAVESISDGLWSGAITTAAAMYSLVFSGFRGFAELGVVAGTSILFCLIAMLTAFPALLVITAPESARPVPFKDRPGRILARLQHRGVAGFLAAISVGGLVFGLPRFDSNYESLEPQHSEAMRLEHAMVEKSDLSPQFAVFVAPDRERASALADRLMDDETVATVRSIADLDELAAVSSKPLPRSLTSAFASDRGRFAVYAYPRGNVWDPEQQARFVAHMQAIDPAVTGMPVLGQFMMHRSQEALVRAGVIGSIVVLLILVLDVRRIDLLLLSFAPTALTIASLLWIMRLCDLPFNPLNIVALPLIIGMSVDSGIHLVHRFELEMGDLRRTLRGTGRSVILTSLTTVAGYGVLVLTSHRGLASFGIVTSLGVTLSLFYSLIVLPPFLGWRQRGNPRRPEAFAREAEPLV